VENVLIEFRDVTKRFGNRTILNNVSLEIYDNHVTTIIGKSGTGKSVLLKHIIGLLSPTEGTILYRGMPIDQMSRKEQDAFRKQFSFCFQNNALFDSLTVFENIALPLQQTTRLSKKKIKTKVMENVEQMDLSEVPYRYPSEISGGMQKRVALARALITDPEIVLFDEPTTGQDPIRRNAILAMIAQKQKKFGFTAIMISHEIPDVFFVSDRILVLYDGQIIFQGTYHEIGSLDHPIVDEFVRSLEGFQDELTGLHSNKSFQTVYEKSLKQKEPHETLTVVLFSLDDLDALDEELGLTRGPEIIQSLGAKIDKHFGKVGLSNRVARYQIVTLLPQTSIQTAERMLDDFAKELQLKGLPDVQVETNAGTHSTGTTFSISAGLAEGKASEDIDALSEKARSNQQTVVRLIC